MMHQPYSMVSSIKVVLFSLLVIAAGASMAPAQTFDPAHWKQCDLGHAPRFLGYVPYFINERYGFAYLGPDDPNIPNMARAPMYRTNDGGATWSLCDTLSYRGAIYGLTFVTAAHGYAALGPTANGSPKGGGVFETWDTGFTWRNITHRDSLTSDWVQTLGSYTFTVGGMNGAGGPFGASQCSTNDGFSWQVPDAKGSTGATYPIPDFWFGDLFTDRESFLASNASRITHMYFVATLDGGQSWNAYSSPFDVPYRIPDWQAYCMPHRRDWFIQDGLTKILHCSGLSGNWPAVLSNPQNNATTPYTLANEIEGAGCAVYVQGITGYDVQANPYGVLARTTDLGNTWTPVACPGFQDVLTQGSNHFCVVSNGAVIYMITGKGNMYKSTDGGDGALAHVSDAHTITFGHALPSSSALDTLKTTLCDSTSLRLQFQYTGSCSYGWLDHVQIDGIDSLEYSTTQTHHFPSENKADTAWMTISPTHLGLRQLVVHAVYTNDDKQMIDTSFTLNLAVSVKPGLLSVTHGSSSTRSPIDFGTQALCNATKLWDSIGIGAPACALISVDSVAIRASGIASQDYSFVEVKDVALSADPQYFRISFKPSTAATERATIVVYSFDGISNNIDSIHVIGAGAVDPRNFSIRADTLVTNITAAVTGTIALKNTTCGTLTMDSVVLPSGVTLPLGLNQQPQLPLSLNVLDTGGLIVQFMPTGVGVFPETILAHMRFVEHAQTTQFDTTIAFVVRVMRTGGVAISTMPSFGISQVVPNPASNRVRIVLAQSAASRCNVAILDVLGREVMNAVASTEGVEFDLSGLAEGSYYVRANCGGQVATRAIVVRR